MSGPKDVVYDYDADLVRQQAEALRRAEEERFAALSGTPRNQLGESDFDLVQRFEAEQNALHALNAARRALLRDQIHALHATWQYAAQSRAAMMQAHRDFAPPALPSRIADAVIMGDDTDAMATAMTALRTAMQGYEQAFTAVYAALAERTRAAGMNQAAKDATAMLCYATELVAEAEQTEARHDATRRMAFQRQRQDADVLLRQAQTTDAAMVSAEAVDLYRAFLETADYGARSNHLEGLRRQLHRDAERHREQQRQAAALAAEEAALNRKRVLMEACRAMGWQVIDAAGPNAGSVYVAQSGFTNHVRQMRLEQMADGKAHLLMQTLPVEGAPQRVRAEVLAKQEQNFNLKLCGQNGEIAAFNAILAEKSFAFSQVKKTVPPAAAAVPLAHVPAGLRTQLEAEKTTAATTSLKEMPIPKPD